MKGVVSPAPRLMASTGAMLLVIPTFSAKALIFFIPVAMAMRTVIWLRESTRPLRNRVGPAEPWP